MSTNSVGWYHLYPPCHLLILSPKSGNHITIPERVEGWETARSVLRGKVHPPLLMAFPCSPALHPGLPSLPQRGSLNPARKPGRALYAVQTGFVATNTFIYILSTWHVTRVHWQRFWFFCCEEKRRNRSECNLYIFVTASAPLTRHTWVEGWVELVHHVTTFIFTTI